MPVAQPKPKPTSKGRAGAKTAQDAAAQQQFEKEHPRAAKGRVGGGAWIEKGQGMQGTPDSRVKQLQNRLASLGYNVQSDGRFGPVTEQATRAFQRRNGLTVDGKVGEATTAALQSGHPVGAQAAAAGHAAAGAPSAPAAPSATASASPGAYGAKYAGDSAAAQKARGDQNEALAGQRDLGTKTKAQKHAASQAKKAHRKSSSRSRSGSGVTTTDSGVVSDGGSLEGGDPNAGTGTSRSTRSRSHATDTIALGLGMDRARGDSRVKELQQMLDDIGGNLGAGGVDGKFGPDTKKALLRFQRRYGLKADGIMGKKTRMALNTVQKLMNARDRVRPGSSLSEHLTNDRAVVMAVLHEADTKHDYPTRDAPGASSKGEGMKRCPSCGWRNAKGTTKCKKCSANLAKKGDAKLSEADGPKIKLGNKPGKSNWVEKAGGLPGYIKRIAEHVKGKNPGWNDGRCIAVAVNAAKKMCSSGDTNLPGAQQVNAASKAEACAAVASWEAKKGKSLSEAELFEIATFAHRPVLAEGFTLRELEEAARGSSRRAIMRLADGTFAPKGTGRALEPGDKVRHIASGDHHVVLDNAPGKLKVEDKHGRTHTLTQDKLSGFEAHPTGEPGPRPGIGKPTPAKQSAALSRLSSEHGKPSQREQLANGDRKLTWPSGMVKHVAVDGTVRDGQRKRPHVTESALEEADITFDPRKHPRGRGGEFRRTLGKLRKAGDTLKMPDGTTVTRGQRYHNLAVPGASGSGSGTAYIVKGRDGKAQRVFSSDQAANLALGMSASSTHPESLGGTTSHPSITAFEQTPAELAKARAAQDAADRARFEKDRAESDAHIARLEAARRPDGTIRFRNGEGRTGTMYPGPSLEPYRGGGTPVVVSWDDLPNVEGGRGVTPLYAHIEPLDRPAPASPGTPEPGSLERKAMEFAEKEYHRLIAAGWSPREAARYSRDAERDHLARLRASAGRKSPPASPGTGTPGTPGIKPYSGMGKFVVVQQDGHGGASVVDGANTPEAARAKARRYPGTTTVHPNEPGSPPAPGTVYRYGKRATATRTAPPASPGVPNPSIAPEHRTALADAIEGYAEGVGEILRDDWDPADGEPPETFPWEEDLLAAADRVRAGSIEGIDGPTLDAIVDQLSDDSGVLPGDEPLLPPAAVAELRRAAGMPKAPPASPGTRPSPAARPNVRRLPHGHFNEDTIRDTFGLSLTDPNVERVSDGVYRIKSRSKTPGRNPAVVSALEALPVIGSARLARDVNITATGGKLTAGSRVDVVREKDGMTIFRHAGTVHSLPTRYFDAQVRNPSASPGVPSARAPGEATPEQRRATAARARQAERLNPAGSGSGTSHHRDRESRSPVRQGSGMASPGTGAGQSPPAPGNFGEGQPFVGRRVNVRDSIYNGTIIGWTGDSYRVRLDRGEGADPALAGAQPHGAYRPADLVLLNEPKVAVTEPPASDSRMLASGRGPFTSYEAAFPAAEAYANRLGREVGLRKSREFGKDVYTVHPLPNAANRYGSDLQMQVVPPTRTTAQIVDQRVASAPNFADAMSRAEAALAAGVPIADLLAAQDERLGRRPPASPGVSDLSALHPLGSSVTTTVHSIGGRSEKVTGEVVKHRRNAVDVRTANHGTIVVPRSQIENQPPASPGITSTAQFLASMTPEQRAAVAGTGGVRDGEGLTFAQRQAQVGSPDANEAEALALLDTDPAAAREKLWDAWEGLPVGPSPRKARLEAAAKAAQRGDAEAARRALAAA